MIEKKYTYSDFDTKYFKEHNLNVKNFDINKDMILDNNEVKTMLSVFDVKSVGYLLTQEKLKNETLIHQCGLEIITGLYGKAFFTTIEKRGEYE